jgi:hypothetical protein
MIKTEGQGAGRVNALTKSNDTNSVILHLLRPYEAADR